MDRNFVFESVSYQVVLMILIESTSSHLEGKSLFSKVVAIGAAWDWIGGHQLNCSSQPNREKLVDLEIQLGKTVQKFFGSCPRDNFVI